jgi:hypothetical protein
MNLKNLVVLIDEFLSAINATNSDGWRAGNFFKGKND